MSSTGSGTPVSRHGFEEGLRAGWSVGVASGSRVREVADRSVDEGVSRPRWIEESPRRALPDRSIVCSAPGRRRRAGGRRRRDSRRFKQRRASIGVFRRRACGGSRRGLRCRDGICTTAATCRTWFIRRFPARDSGGGLLAGRGVQGAVPVQDANRLRSANGRDVADVGQHPRRASWRRRRRPSDPTRGAVTAAFSSALIRLSFASTATGRQSLRRPSDVGSCRRCRAAGRSPASL